MRDLACLEIHPDDQPPIQRRCGRMPDHAGDHKYRGYSGTNTVDRWPNDTEGAA